MSRSPAPTARAHIAPLEPAEVELEAVVPVWLERHGWQATLDALFAGMLEARGVAKPRGVERLDGLDPRWLADPHLLGWFHQHAGAAAREASFAAHTGMEAKHATATISTQLYTPRWVADLLVGEALDALAPSAARSPIVLDPACGGGQMLLAAFYRLRAMQLPTPAAIGALWGVDLDPRAVEACRKGLYAAVAGALGRRDPALEAQIDRQVVCADGLFDPPPVDRADVVVTNPPYMGSRSMPAPLKTRINDAFRPFHHDLYLAFLRRCHDLVDGEGVVAVLAQQTVWYGSRFEKARRWLVDRGDLVAFFHLGPHVFRGLSGEKANVVAFVQRGARRDSAEGGSCRFVDARALSSAAAMRDALCRDSPPGSVALPIEAFEAIPGAPLCHWLPEPLRRRFGARGCLGDIAEIPGGPNKTAANRRFVHPWDAVDPSLIRPAEGLWEQAGAVAESAPRWAFYSKGGRYAPWWGNWHHVIDWSEQARSYYRDNPTSNLLAEAYWFRRGLCYTDFGGRRFNARLLPAGCLFDMAGPAIFLDGDDADALHALLVVLNSAPVRALLNALNPSIHYQVRDLRNLPLPDWDGEVIATLAPLGRRLVEDVRWLHRFSPGDPLAASTTPEERERARALLADLPRREAEAEAKVAAWFGVPAMVTPTEDRRMHGALGRLTL